MSGTTTDRSDPRLEKIDSRGLQEVYLVLSEEERGKGFIRPFRTTYTHVGLKPVYPLRELTEKEHANYDDVGYVKFEEYPKDDSLKTGRFWTQEQLDTKGCGVETKMGQALSETYARNPKFYGATYCVGCEKHFPVKEFIWTDGNIVGS